MLVFRTFQLRKHIGRMCEKYGPVVAFFVVLLPVATHAASMAVIFAQIAIPTVLFIHYYLIYDGRFCPAAATSARRILAFCVGAIFTTRTITRLLGSLHECLQVQFEERIVFYSSKKYAIT